HSRTSLHGALPIWEVRTQVRDQGRDPQIGDLDVEVEPERIKDGFVGPAGARLRQLLPQRIEPVQHVPRDGRRDELVRDDPGRDADEHTFDRLRERTEALAVVTLATAQTEAATLLEARGGDL